MSRRLTNTIRDAFIRHAMSDVPTPVDHQEEIRTIVTADIIAQLPATVRAVWENLDTRAFLETGTFWPVQGMGGVEYPRKAEWPREDPKLTAKVRAKVDKLAAEHKAQRATHDALEAKLRSVAYGCATRKALADALPEFEKYLPADEVAACRTLPVVANVVADFVKAGWPKDKKPEPVAA